MNQQPTLFETRVLPLFEEHRGDWLATARAAARFLGHGGAPVTIDAVRKLCPPPADVDPRVMGAVFLRREWTRIGFEQSARRECHGRPVAVHRLKEYAA